MASVRGPHGDDLDAMVGRLEALVVRVLRRIARFVARRLGTLGGPTAVTPDDAAAIRVLWQQHVTTEIEPAVARAYGTAAAAVAARLAEFGHDLPALTAQSAEDYLRQARNRWNAIGDDTWSEARQQLADGVTAGEDIGQLATRVRSVADVTQAKSRTIARTETIAAANAATVAQARVLADPTVVKEWLATLDVDGVGCDARTRPTHCAANGQRVPIGDRFRVGAAFLAFPGDPIGPPAETFNCRCSIAVDLDDEPTVGSAGQVTTIGSLALDAGEASDLAGGLHRLSTITIPAGTEAADEVEHLDVGRMMLSLSGDGSVTVATVDADHTVTADELPALIESLRNNAEFHLPGRHNQKTHGRRGPRIPTPTGPGGAGSADDALRASLTRQRVPELRQRARDRGLAPGRARKAELVEMIHAAERGAGPQAGRKLSPGADPKRAISDAVDGDTAAETAVQTAMIATYTYTDWATGLRTEPAGFQHDRYSVTMDLKVLDAAGRRQGSATRTWTYDPDSNRLTVDHEYLNLRSTVQGGGFAQRFNAEAETAYREAGVEDITLHADLDVGGYAWATQGYDWDRHLDLTRVTANFSERLSGLPDGDPLRDEIQTLLDRSIVENFEQGTAPTPFEFAMVGRHLATAVLARGGREILMWPGKEWMMQSDWHGRKSVTGQPPQPVTAASDLDRQKDRRVFLAAQARASLAHANAVAELVPAYPEDAHPDAQGRSDYAEHHHLISAPPEVDEVLVETANEILGRATEVPSGDDERGVVPIVAAAQVHDGAMVALVLTDEDAARLAVDGGESPDQLHLTLAYLGKAADIPADTRQEIVDAMRSVAGELPVGEADGFAVSVFNPGDANDRDTCVVLGLSGDGLEDVHDQVEETLHGLQDAAGFTMPEQHAPWHPHITLTYTDTDDLSIVEQLTDRVGLVTFDRLRVAFAGETVDIPLGAPADDTADDDEYSAAAVEEFVRSDAPLRAYWTRGKGAVKIRWNTPGDFTRCVRQLRKYVRDPKGLCAVYHREATGKWPGEHDGHADEGEDTMNSDAADPADIPQDVNVQPSGPGPVTAAAAEGDCPPGQHRMPDGQCMPDEQMGTGLLAQPGEHFHTTVMEGVSTGAREFAPDSIGWREPPFAFHWQSESSAHSGTPTVVQVGLVTRAVRDGATVHFFGRLDLRSPEGLDYARRLVDGFARWSSVGLDESLKESDIEYVMPAGQPDENADPQMLFAPEPEKTLIRKARVAEVTAVSVPALADATVEPTAELVDALADLGVATSAPEPAAEDALVAGAVGTHHTGTVEDGWDADANVARLPSPVPLGTARNVFADIDESRADDGAVPKDACSFPHHDVSADGTPGAANLTACSTGLAAVHGARSGQRTGSRGVYDHLRTHLVDGGRDPDSIKPFETTAGAQAAPAGPVVAAGYTVTIPDLPPAEWFDEPADDDLPPHGVVWVNEHGRLAGMLAPGAVNHRSFPGRAVKVPMGNVDYSGWMNKRWPTADGGDIFVGVITMDCGHASVTPGDHSYSHRREHYDNSCAVAAHARIYEKPGRGVCVAGAVAPWLDGEGLGRLLSCDLSGDWPPHPDRAGWRDFVAALAVPVGALPNRVPASSVRVADGALVAAAVPVRFTPPEAGGGLRPVLERIARSVGMDAHTRMESLHARIHRHRCVGGCG